LGLSGVPGQQKIYIPDQGQGNKEVAQLFADKE
jgi:hypothetical protein